MQFKATCDKLCKVTTLLSLLLFASIILIQFLFITSHQVIIGSLTALLLLAILIVTYGYSPRFYTVDADEIVIHRFFNPDFAVGYFLSKRLNLAYVFNL